MDKVEQLGDAWKEQIVVTSGYEGNVVAIDTADDAITIVVETRSGKRVSYALEKGAVVDEGHHAARTLPALRAQHPNLIVTSMENLEVSP